MKNVTNVTGGNIDAERWDHLTPNCPISSEHGLPAPF